MTMKMDLFISQKFGGEIPDGSQQIVRQIERRNIPTTT